MLRAPRGAGDLAGALRWLLDAVGRRGYLAVMAYLDRFGDAAVAELRPALARRRGRPVTFGWGPRFLHSTGQYHKGGPQVGAFLQITGAVARRPRVPGQPYTFGQLQAAQAAGDRQALAGAAAAAAAAAPDRPRRRASQLLERARRPACDGGDEATWRTEHRREPAARPAGPAAAPDPRAVRAGHLRRHR